MISADEMQGGGGPGSGAYLAPATTQDLGFRSPEVPSAAQPVRGVQEQALRDLEPLRAVAGSQPEGVTVDGRWIEVADGVLVRRHAELDVSTGLVLGDRRCLVIDTLGDGVQGAQLAAAVREVTTQPWTVVLTHGHFDHCFGTSAFVPCGIWAHRGMPGYLARTADAQRREWSAYYRGRNRPDVAGALGTARMIRPNSLVNERVDLDLGGRKVALHHFGPAHTDHDLAVHLPDVELVFAGDLVEQGAPPSVDQDSQIQHWPVVLDRLLSLQPRTVVPGHGDPVDAEFVAQQRQQLAAYSG